MKIVLGGEEFTLTFNMGFLRLLVKEYGIDPLNLGDSLTGEQFFNLAYGIIFCGAATTHKLQQRPGELNKEVIEAAVDELHPDKVNAVIAGLMKWLQTPEEVQPKKKGGGSKAATFPVG